jgi:hypothetical protein
MAKSKSVTVGDVAKSATALLEQLSKAQADAAASRAEAVALRSQVEALAHDVIRVRQFADKGRHEQVQAYRDACGAVVASLNEMYTAMTGLDIPVESFDPMVSRARAAIAAAKELP